MNPMHLLSDDEFAQLVRDAAALPDAPDALIRAVIDQWHSPPPSLRHAAATAIYRRIVAALTFDSWTPGQLAHGVRAVPSDNRHLLFSALGRDIDVRVTPTRVGFIVAGQILGPDEGGAVELAPVSGAPDAAGVKGATVDAMGQFRIEGVDKGAYVLRLRLGTDEIELPPIDLGERAD